MKSFLFYHATSQASVVIITIALMLFVGYLMTRITRKFKLPNVTGYILAGILMGPYCLDMVPVKVIDGMDFLSDIALAFIAFSTGEFFRFSVLKKNGLEGDRDHGYGSGAGIGMCICSGLWGAPLKSGIFHCTGSSGISYSSCVHHHDHPSDRSEGRFC